MKRCALALALLCCSRPYVEPTEQTRSSPQLGGPAEIIVDSHGWPHVSAPTLRDAAFAEGYAMARDRMLQLEFFRRAANGRLAEVYGSISGQFIETDILLRTLGLRRTAQAMWDALPEGRSRTLFEGFSDGVNLYLEELRRGDRPIPRGAELLLGAKPPEWSPVDSFAVLRLLVFYLSYHADTEVSHTLLRERAAAVFEQADPAAADLFARRGFFSEVFQLAPPSSTATLPDFYAAAPRKPLRPHARKRPRVETAMLYDALRPRLFPEGDATGSNAWAVSGARSANGHALIAGDPHQGLLSPCFLWGVHLTVTEGPDAVDITGVAFPGVPGVVFGHSGTVAWGITNAAFDQIDVYDETVTVGTGGAPDTVLFNGMQVPIETRIEKVPNGLTGTLDVKIETVPHHGPILPRFEREGVLAQRKANGHALSVRWVASEPTHEVEGLVALLYAPDVPAAMAAVRNIEAPALSFVFADRSGRIGFRQVARVPIRAAGARTWDPLLRADGTMPALVMPGTGEAEWLGDVHPDLVPNVMNPPWIGTANNDPAFTSRDGNPFDAKVYLGYDWAEGYRYERIAERLTVLGSATREDLEAMQNDHVVLAGKRLTPSLVGALSRLAEERGQPGTHADLGIVAERTKARAALFDDLAERMGRWKFDSPSGLEADASDETRDEAVAAAVFHAWLARVFDLSLSDEFDALQEPGKGSAVISLKPRRLLFAITAMLDRPAANPSVLWDDLKTPDVKETRDAILLAALDAAVTDLTELTKSEEPAGWLWGKVHTLRLGTLFPHVSLALGADLNVPQLGDKTFPNGFPRPGGIETIDQGWPSIEDSNGRPAPLFHYTEGPAERRTVDMGPAGPTAFSVIAGGNSSDLGSPHFRDDLELWRVNQTHALLRDAAEIDADAERRIHLTP